jgi:hypothetical protein
VFWTDAIPYFPRHELACKGTGEIRLDLRFAAALPALRQAWNSPLTPNSVCRTPAHNSKVGGHPRSLHLTENPAYPGAKGAMAADLDWKGWAVDAQLRFARLAYSMGWSVGLHNSFIHVDWRKAIGLTQAVFLYGAWDNRFTADQVREV